LKKNISFCPFMYNIIRLGDQHPPIWGETSMNFKSSKIRWVLALTFALVVALAVIITVTSKHVNVRAASSATGATIASDQADYMPGATVTLTGAGWASGEDVQIYVNDSVGNTWSLTSGQNGAPPDPVADNNGGFTYSFSLPSTFIASYSVTATGPTSGTATMTFTDSNNDPCPSNDPTTWQTDNQVGASSTTSGLTATYTFSSFVNENSSGGIPGLIEYCVYPASVPHDVAVDPALKGANGSAWTFSLGSSRFSFSRPGGDPSNIPLNGTTGITMGAATWSSSLPTSQVIVLHVNDPAECNALYKDGSLTCFVLPGTPQKAKDLTVSKTATPSFNRTFTWGITKSVDNTKVIDSSGSHTFNYTVSVTHDNGTDSGWQVNGTIKVSNPNGFDVAGIDVTDAIDNNGTCTVGNGTGVTVPANSSVTLNYTCTFGSAPSSGTNTATASWDNTKYNTPDSQAQGTATYDFSKVSPTVVDGSVSVTDTLGGPLGTVSYTDSSPKTIAYQYKVTGTPGTCVTQNNTATFTTNTNGKTGSASQSVQLCTPVDLKVTKDATPSFTRTFTWGITKSVDQSKQTIAAGGTATFNYTVTVTHDAGTDSNWQVNGTITVSNPNDFEDIVANVADAIDNGGTCTITGGSNVTVPAGKSVTLDYTCSYASAPSPPTGTNTATATWDKAAANTPTGTASGTASVDFRTTNPTVVDGKITVVDDKTNPGNPVTLGTVSYTDPSPKDFTYALQLSGVGGTCTDYKNTATFTTDTSGTTGSASQTITLCVAVDLKVTTDATPSFTRTFKWGITKSVDQTKVIDSSGSHTFTYTVSVTHDGGTDSDWQVNGTITVTNPNSFEDIVANVSDTIDNGGNCTVTGGTNLTVPAGKSVPLSYSCTYSSAPNPGSGTNTATASWDQTTASTPDGSAQGTASFDFGSVSPTLVDASVSVTDTLGGTLGMVKSTDPSPTTFTYTHKVTGTPGTCVSQGNTATFTTNTTGTIGLSSQSVQLCTPEDLVVTKDANPSFTRTYNWSISKMVDKTLVEQLGGGTATLNYTVKVSETGFTDSNWQVMGTIIVSNPNDFESITLTGVTDALDNSGTCKITGGNTTAAIPAGGIAALSYTCSYPSQPAYNTTVTNTATATWDQTAASTPSGSATGSATFKFTAPTTTVNKTVTITDTFNGVKTTLGTLTATDSTPFTSQTFTYSHTVNVPKSNCVTYPNTATIVETGQTASAMVEVCGPAKTGALTMGYWQNKNGQGIITNQAKTGPCPSAAWLTQYAPFQDLSSTATCSQVAAYVTTVINAATCGGSTCNAMLKAQMLATALDVYFSDPVLGGNQIGAPAPIGGVKIDLTNIGSFENVSSAFGGATSLTVSQMLAYAASQSNAGGSTWYSNVKATQVLAKDAFDAINNQVAFAP
jgi:LEA14-like dessication related protein